MVNEHTTGTQIQPAVHALPHGGFVVVWTSNSQDGYGLGVFGRVFDDEGVSIGSEFQVNAFTTCSQFAPAVGRAGQGFVVVWQSGPIFSTCTQDGSDFGVFARVYDATGAALSEELQVNTYTPYAQAYPSVSGDAGGFIVVWDSLAQDGDGFGVFGRVFQTDGAAAGPEFRVSEQTGGDQYEPSVTQLGTGFAAVWLDSRDAEEAIDVRVRRFAGNGAAEGPELLVSGYTEIERGRPLIAQDAGSGALALWSDRTDERSFDVVGRRLDFNAMPLGTAFQVNTFTTNRQVLTGVATSNAGFVVVWNSLNQDGDYEGAFGRRLGTNALPSGPEFPVSAYTLGEQSAASAAALPSGDFVVAWSSPADASEYAIVAARFGHDHALAECGDADAGGTITARDALLVLRASTGNDTCTLPACDIDDDGQLTTSDALGILRQALGLSTPLNCDAA